MSADSFLAVAGAPEAGPYGVKSRRRAGWPVACVVILTISLLNWRVGTYYAGGLDPVVAAKGLLGLVALALSVHLVRSAPERHWVGLRTVLICAAYLCTALIGGLAGNALGTNIILVLRVVIVLLTMLCLMMSGPLDDLIDQVSVGLAGVGVVLAVAGVPSYASTGRLAGGILPVNPNAIALLFGPLILASLWRMLNGLRKHWDLANFLGLIAATWLTGSRTGLAGLVVGLIVIMLIAPRLPAPAVVGVIFAVPSLVYLLYLSPLLSKFFDRGGVHNVTTLNSRTIAWQSAFSARADFWQHWMGRGLGVKEVAVSGAFWNAQILDSSWLSAFVQVGLIGVALLALWVLVSLISSACASQPYRGFLVGTVLYAAINSVLMTGLLDAYILFVVMLLPALGSEIAKVDESVRGQQSQSSP